MGWFPAALAAGGILGSFLLLGPSLRGGSHGPAGPATASAAAVSPTDSNASAPPIAEALFNLTAPRWPAAFDAPPPPGESHLPAHLLPRNALADMQKAYGFYARQLQLARVLAVQFPALQADLGAAQSAFAARYGPAVENIDRLVAEWNAVAARQMHDTAAAGAHRLDVSRVSATSAQAYATELHRRAKGQHLPSPMGDALLAFDPAYVANPAREFDDGYVNTYHAPADGPTDGLKIAFIYPRSWRSSPGSGLQVQHFHDRRSGLAAATITADYLNDPAITRPQQIPWLLKLDDVLDTAPDAKLLDAGVVVLPDGKQALWRECTFTEPRASSLYRIRAVDFTLICGEKYVSFGFSAGVDASADDDALDRAYRRNAPLYKRMMCDATVSRRG